MSHNIEVEFLFKRLTDFQLLRIVRAQKHAYVAWITAYLSDVFISNRVAYGVTFAHTLRDTNVRYADGHFIRTAVIRSVCKEGRFWVVSTSDARYVITSFRKDVGRASFHTLLRSSVEGFRTP